MASKQMNRHSHVRFESLVDVNNKFNTHKKYSNKINSPNQFGESLLDCKLVFEHQNL
jgi:hypothetical protein